MVARVDSKVPLRPLWHMTGFLGSKVPVFEIEHYYNNTENHTLLVNTAQLGRDLASEFDANNATDPSDSTGLPEHSVVLQRGHGFSCWGTSIEQAVYRAVYTQDDARIQANAQEVAHADSGSDEGVRYLSNREVSDTGYADSTDLWVQKAWSLWSRQVAINPLYQ